MAFERLVEHIEKIKIFHQLEDRLLKDRSSAILILLFVPNKLSVTVKGVSIKGVDDNRRDQVHVLLTVRSKHLKRHAGEICLPGGTRELDDADLSFTARREANEEIGLPLDPSIEILGRLECTVIGNAGGVEYVLPFVAIVHSAHLDLVASTDEVDCIFAAPLAIFLSPEHHQSHLVTWTDGNPWRVHHVQWKDWHIWGMTCHLLIHVASIVLGKSIPFDHRSLSDVKWREWLNEKAKL